MQETWVWSRVRKIPHMAIHSSILAWRSPWTEEQGWLQSTGWQKVGHDWSHWACMHEYGRFQVVLVSFFLEGGCILRTTLRNLGVSQATGFLMPSFILYFFPVVSIQLFLKMIISRNLEHRERIVDCFNKNFYLFFHSAVFWVSIFIFFSLSFLWLFFFFFFFLINF